MADLLKTNAPSFGDPSAPVSIVEFSDFQCPFCKRMATTLRDQVLPKEGKKVRIIFRQFPLEMHHNARPEAELSECVEKQSNDEFWSLHDFLFSHQTDKWRDDAFAFLKERKNLNMHTLSRCLDQKASASSVDGDLQLGQKYGVSATPTMFVNGVRISGARDAESVEQVIESAIRTK